MCIVNIAGRQVMLRQVKKILTLQSIT